MGAGGRSGLDPHVRREWLWAFANQTHEYAILILDAAGRIRWANPGAGFVLGVPPDALEGRPVKGFFTEEDAAAGIPELEMQVASLRGSAADDRWMARADGSRFWATGITLSPAPDSVVPSGFLKLFRDHTERKMLFEAIHNRAECNARESEDKSNAIAVLAHEFRGPLSAVSMATEVLANAGVDEAQLQSALGVIRRNVGFAVRLVEDLEEHSRAAAGKLSLQHERVALAGLLDAAITIARHRTDAQQRPIALVMPGAGIDIDADPLRIRQVFVNLVANAIRYTPQPGRIWVTASLEGTEAVVQVSDQGVGIAPDMLDRIFEMFTQVRTPSSNGGLGVGLALVKTIIELHGGSVQARSEGVGKGSEFTVRLPLRRRGRPARGSIVHPVERPAAGPDATPHG